MALPADFSNIYGSTATGGLTPISDVNYAKGWEFVGSNPPTKNDFSYLQNLSDLKAQYLYKAIGGDSGAPAIGIPFFWPSASMPSAVLPEWSNMVFLKFNGSTFSATTYPKLALVIPSLTLPDVRGEFPRFWDDGRGVDSGRAILSAQLDALQNITGSFHISDNNGAVGGVGAPTGAFTGETNPGKVPVWTTGALSGSRYVAANFNAANVARVSAETRPRNVAFNLLVRAK